MPSPRAIFLDSTGRDCRRRPRPPRRGKISLVGIILGLLTGIAVAIALLRFSTGERNSPITPAELQAAQQRWHDRGPASYDLDIELTGNRPGTVHIEVRDGQATHMIRDGVEPKQRRTWAPWTVPGMFDTIEQELEKIKDPAAGFNAPPGSTVVIRGEFDRELGYPKRYHRIVLGTQLEIRWIVTRFEPGADHKPAAQENAPAEAPPTEQPAATREQP